MPKVSIVLTTYNSEQYIERSLDSVMAQTLADWECVIVDDGSHDRTLPILMSRANADTRIIVVPNARNEGPGPARNRGIAQTHGEWVAFLDADDWWENDRLEEIVRYGATQHLDVVLDDLILHDESKPGATRLWTEAKPHMQRYLGQTITLSDLCSTSLSSFHPVVRRSVLVTSKIRYPDMRRSEDFGFLFELCIAGYTLGVYPGAKYHYRVRNSGKGLAMYRGIWLSRRKYARQIRTAHQHHNWVPPKEIKKALHALQRQSRMGYRMYVLRKLLNIVAPSPSLKNPILKAYHFFTKF